MQKECAAKPRPSLKFENVRKKYPTILGSLCKFENITFLAILRTSSTLKHLVAHHTNIHKNRICSSKHTPHVHATLCRTTARFTWTRRRRTAVLVYLLHYSLVEAARRFVAHCWEGHFCSYIFHTACTHACCSPSCARLCSSRRYSVPYVVGAQC